MTIVELLRPYLGERLIRPADTGFEAARRVWNSAVTTRPAAIARCRDSAEVGRTVRAANAAGLPVSVRAGGHDWAGRALCEGGVVVDLRGMRAVVATDRSVTVEGGATAADLLAVTGPAGLAAATGVVGSVGMAGLATVGGYGPLTGHCGLALDNLLGAEVVLADGTVAVAGPHDDTELWWAIRGGGGNFGVVTSLTFRLHPVARVLTGMLMFPMDRAATVLNGYAEIVADAPDELTALTGFLPGPDGTHLAFVCPFWSGADLAAGERYVARFRALAPPVVDHVVAIPYAAALGMFDRNIVDGNHYLLRSRWIGAVSPPAVDALVAGAVDISSPYSVILLNRLAGHASRIDPAATAFAHRDPHQVVEVIAVWGPDDGPDRHREWADSVVRGLDPVARPGGYPNLLGPADNDRALTSFGANLDRLRAAKRHYDPGNVFASAVPAL